MLCVAPRGVCQQTQCFRKTDISKKLSPWYRSVWKLTRSIILIALLSKTSFYAGAFAEDLPGCSCEVGSLDCQLAADTAEDSIRYLSSHDCANQCQADRGCQEAFFRLEQILQGCPVGTVQERISYHAFEFESSCSRCREYPPNQAGKKFCPASLHCQNETQALEALNFLRRSCRGSRGCVNNPQCEESWHRLYAMEYMCAPHDVSPKLRESIRSWGISNCKGEMCNLDKREVYFGPDCLAENESYSSGISKGAIAGIVIGGLIGALLIIATTAFALKARKNPFMPFEMATDAKANDQHDALPPPASFHAARN